MKILSFINQKGGVGKTSSSFEIASRFSKKGFKVLCIDGDPQGNLTYLFGLDPDTISPTLKDIFDKKLTLKDTITSSEGVDLIPNNILMSAADRLYSGPSSIFLLQKALGSIKADYDFVIIDSPPSLGVMMWNILMACDYVIIPVNASALSIQGLKALADSINEVKDNGNSKLKIMGILVNRYNPRTKLTKEALPALEEIARQHLFTIVFDSKIRQSVSIEDAQASKLSTDKIKKSLIAKDYDNLADEILNKISEAET